MSTVTTEVASSATKTLILRSYEGIREIPVSSAPARDCTLDEIPVIDLSGMNGDLKARKSIAREILLAAENIGFFYIKNHGISEELISAAREKTATFFALPLEQKSKSSSPVSSYGYHEMGALQANPTQSKDRKEVFGLHYEPEYDPLHQTSLSDVPQRVRDHLPKDGAYIWAEETIPDFKKSILAYWQACLKTARSLISIVALALDLPEDYFESVTSYPGADMVFNKYPGHGENPIEDPDEVGVGSHTDLQILTLLLQDQQKGLQILNNRNQWINAPPLPGTLVVNIGDFLMRLTNDRFRSTVHRVIQHGKEDRTSIAFFFGFNWDEKLGVLPNCTDEHNPPKYEPVTCGELITKRLALGSKLATG